MWHRLCLTTPIFSVSTFKKRKKKRGLHFRPAWKVHHRHNNKQAEEKEGERGYMAQQLANMYISSQEIVRGHLYFITMISSFHLLLAALPLSLIAVFLYLRNWFIYAPQPCQTTLQREKDAHGWRYVQKKPKQHQQIQSCLRYNVASLMQDWQKQKWLFSYILLTLSINWSVKTLKVLTGNVQNISFISFYPFSC